MSINYDDGARPQKTWSMLKFEVDILLIHYGGKKAKTKYMQKKINTNVGRDVKLNF